jgi:hypothetical protein
MVRLSLPALLGGFMSVVEMPMQPEKREILGNMWTVDEMLDFLGDVVDSKIKHGKCPAEEREMEITYLMHVLWHRAPTTKRS